MSKETRQMTRSHRDGGCGKKGASPCGCEERPSAAAQCECGGAGCLVCQGGGYTRPTFFAGQLLTEDDLQALTTYVVVKQRLHNKHFFGEGVVCGLEVKCHPCDGGKVIVKGGHALDCCGNDIVVPCEREVDINSLVRELRLRLAGGYDCGDPCRLVKEDCFRLDKEQRQGDDSPADSDSDDECDSKKDEEKEKAERKIYYLYVRYCEKPSELVSPYPTGEACGHQPCQPTRMREGFRFEVDCRRKKTGGTILDEFCRCIGEFKEFIGGTKQAIWCTLTGRAAYLAAAGVEGGKRPVYPRESLSFAERVQRFRDTSLKDLPRGSLPRARATSILDESLELLRDSVLQDPGEEALRSELFEALKPLRERIPDMTRNLPDYERVELEEIAKLSDPDHAATLSPEAVALLQHGFPYSERLIAMLKDVTDSLPRLTYLGRVRTGAVEPTVRPQPVSYSVGDTPVKKALAIGLRAEKTAWDYLCWLFDCLCNALLPPCPECDDGRVLLATVQVEDCRVVDICNLSRTFVFTNPSRRYWNPAIQGIGCLLERLCCDCILCADYMSCGGRLSGAAPEVYAEHKAAVVSLLSGFVALSEASGLQFVTQAAGILPQLFRVLSLGAAGEQAGEQAGELLGMLAEELPRWARRYRPAPEGVKPKQAPPPETAKVAEKPKKKGFWGWVTEEST